MWDLRFSQYTQQYWTWWMNINSGWSMVWVIDSSTILELEFVLTHHTKLACKVRGVTLHKLFTLALSINECGTWDFPNTKSQLHVSIHAVYSDSCDNSRSIMPNRIWTYRNLSCYRYAGALFMAYWKGNHQWIWEKVAQCNRPIWRKNNLHHHLSDVWKVIGFPFIFNAVKQGCIINMYHIIILWQDSWGSWKLRGSCSLYIWLSMWSSGMFFLFVRLLLKVFTPRKYSYKHIIWPGGNEWEGIMRNKTPLQSIFIPLQHWGIWRGKKMN